MVKHIKKRLLEHPNITSVSDDGLTAFCKCGQNIKLRYPYNDDYVKRHIKNGGCKWTPQNREITHFFRFAEPINTLPEKRFTCMGLCEQIHRIYTQRVQLTTTHGGYPPRHLLAKQLFPEKFPEKVNYSKLNQSELDLLHKEVIQKSKWRIERETVRSTKCELYTSNISKICIECININNDQVFQVSDNDNIYITTVLLNYYLFI